MEGAAAAGFLPHEIVQDRSAAVVLGPRFRRCMLGYVDNFGVLATSEAEALRGAQAISDVLQAKGLRIHPIECSSDSADFIGLRLDLRRLSVSIKPARCIRIRAAIQELLRRKHCSPALLEVVLGHCTWAALLRRESLSIFSAVYRFIRLGGSATRPLWSSVCKELHDFQAIIPLLSIELGAAWDPHIVATDSSPYGLGVTEKHVGAGVASGLGKVHEKWRFSCEAAVKARKNALSVSTDSVAPRD